MRADSLTALIEPVVAGFGCELWGIERLSQGQRATIKIYIDRQEGVDVEDCARVSRQVSALLDVEDPLPGGYTLEVSSPGLDRRFFSVQQLAAYTGARLKVRLKESLDGQRNFVGSLQGLEDGQLLLLTGEDGREAAECRLPFDQVERAQMVPDFGASQQAGGRAQ